MAGQDALEIVNRALILCGETPLSEMEGEGASQRVANRFYQDVVDEALSSHPWNFNRRIEVLTEITGAPPEATGFSKRFQRPALCFRLVRLFVAGTPIREWSQAGDQFYLDAIDDEEVALEYHTRVDERLWHSTFREAMVYRLAAAFCLPLTESADRAKALNELAVRQMMVARNTNGQERPIQRIPVNNLTSRRAR